MISWGAAFSGRQDFFSRGTGKSRSPGLMALGSLVSCRVALGSLVIISFAGSSWVACFWNLPRFCNKKFSKSSDETTKLRNDEAAKRRNYEATYLNRQHETKQMRRERGRDRRQGEWVAAELFRPGTSR